MTEPPCAVLPLADVGGGDRASAGGKAAVLGELRRRGFAVPDGVVLATTAHRVAREATADPAGWEVPADAADMLEAARLRFGGCVAVRSSATDEDAAAGSAAGRYATVLDVGSRDDLLAAVRTCWASAAGSGAAMAVLVQPMVVADRTGVAFTADPVTGERDIVIVVAGAPGAVTEGGPGCEWRLRLVGEPAENRAWGGPADDRLRPGAIRAVAETAAAIAAVLGTPTDVEWALHRDRVTVLQARPMTALPDPLRWVAPLPGGWLRNFRLGEWLPGPVSPLFESWFVERMEAQVRRRAGREAGLVMRPPLHVTVAGWYFHAPLGTRPVATLLGALVRNPRFAVAGAVVGWRPEASERMVVRRFTRRWHDEVLPMQVAMARMLSSRVEQAGQGELVTLVDAAADVAGTLFWSLSMVGGFAWKVEAVLARSLARRMPAAEALEVAAFLARPPVGAAAPSAVQSLDWIHPVPAPTSAVLARRPVADEPDMAAARAACGHWRWRRVERLARLARRYARLREEQAAAFTSAWPALRSAVQRLGASCVAAGNLADAEDVWFLRLDELTAALDGRPTPPVTQRRSTWLAQHRLAPPLQLGALPGPVAGLLPPRATPTTAAVVVGQPGGPGRATGRVVVAVDLAGAERLMPGEVLVAPLVTPAWCAVVSRAAAVVTDGGTVAAHSALICRELHVPLVVATGDATSRLLDGELVAVDGAAGTVVLVAG